MIIAVKIFLRLLFWVVLSPVFVLAFVCRLIGSSWCYGIEVADDFIHWLMTMGLD